MHLVDTHKGDAAKKTAAETHFGMGLDAATVEKVVTVEVHGTNFNDPGPDYCLLIAKDADGVEIATVRREGY